VIADAGSAQVFGTIWLTAALVGIALLVARLWETLPADRGFRRRLGGWLAAFVAALSLYSAWILYFKPEALGKAPPSPERPRVSWCLPR
jgi:hypothetical protein